MTPENSNICFVTLEHSERSTNTVAIDVMVVRIPSVRKIELQHTSKVLSGAHIDFHTFVDQKLNVWAKDQDTFVDSYVNDRTVA